MRDVEISFINTTVASGITFAADSGESVAIVGPSGSGKSSLLGCIAGLLSPSQGSIVVGRVEVTNATESVRAKVRRELVANVFQDPHLLEELTVRENVELPSRFRGATRGDARERAERALDDVNTLHLADRWVYELSGGEAQRVSLARALSTDCMLVLADEPTASLDRAAAAKVADVLIGASKHADRALVIATHDPAVADRCDRVVDLTNRIE